LVAINSESTVKDCQQLASVVCPTLLTVGDIDLLTTLDAVEEMEAHIPDAIKQFEVFKNRLHDTHQDDSRAFEIMKNLSTK